LIYVRSRPLLGLYVAFKPVGSETNIQTQKGTDIQTQKESETDIQTQEGSETDIQTQKGSGTDIQTQKWFLKMAIGTEEPKIGTEEPKIKRGSVFAWLLHVES
jgi:hypothetical protein